MLLKEKIDTLDVEKAREDVQVFIKDNLYWTFGQRIILNFLGTTFVFQTDKPTQYLIHNIIHY